MVRTRAGPRDFRPQADFPFLIGSKFLFADDPAPNRTSRRLISRLPESNWKELCGALHAIAPRSFCVRISQTAFVKRLAPASCFQARQAASIISMLLGYNTESSAVHCAMLMKLVRYASLTTARS